MEPNTRFRAGSLSKNLTALLALRLHNAGLVDLEATFDVSRWVTGREPKAAITLASLLEHTAGLPGSTYRDYAIGAPDASPKDFLAKFTPLSLRWRPRQFYSYSNPGYGLVGAILEEASRLTFDELMDKKVFQPLGLESASFLTAGD